MSGQSIDYSYQLIKQSQQTLVRKIFKCFDITLPKSIDQQRGHHILSILQSIKKGLINNTLNNMNIYDQNNNLKDKLKEMDHIKFRKALFERMNNEQNSLQVFDVGQAFIDQVLKKMKELQDSYKKQ